jgi:uncharacterized protein
MTLPQKRLGRTHLEVTLLGLGGLGILSKCNHTPGSASYLIHAALDHGINFIDTARSYADSEERIGKALRGRRHKCIIASKTMARSFRGAVQDLQTSLRMLQTDYIDLYQIHHLQWQDELHQVLQEDGALHALKQAQAQGLIGHIGLTAHLPQLAIQALATGFFDTIQAPYNPLDGPMFCEILHYARKQDMGIIIMKPIAGGLLADHAGLALRYCLEQEISSVIPGMSTLEHIQTNIKYIMRREPLSQFELDDLLRTAQKIGQNQCRRCGYCLTVCPQKIAIMDIFRFEKYLDRYKTGHWAKEQYSSLSVKADQCQECGQCETICPYHLPIRRLLTKAHEKLSQTVTAIEYAYHGVMVRE